MTSRSRRGTHGGCMRVLSRANSGRRQARRPQGQDRRASAISADRTRTSSRSSSPSTGIDPNKDVDWRVYPGNLLQLAVEKGEVQAFLASDPIAYLWLKDTAYKEVASNLDGEYKDKTCCIVGLRGSLVREEPQVARGVDAGRCSMRRCSPRRIRTRQRRRSSPMRRRPPACRICRRWSRYHTHHHHPTGASAQAGAQGLCRRS